MENFKTTSFEQLQEYAKGTLVELPEFSEGQKFFARLRRPSMLVLAKTGKIPNRLLNTANKLFMESGITPEDEAFMPEAFEVFDAILEASFVEPTYKQIKESGIELTDEQMMFVFSYTQQGVKALERFRNVTANNKRNRNGKAVQQAAK